jgi:ParB-like nuclease domain
MKIQICDLHPNPFRRLDRYPVKREKVDALKRSITDTAFWDNLLVRKNPDGPGYQIAFGHNRLAALNELGIIEIDVPVRYLDDTAMAKIMANENTLEWSYSSAIERESGTGGAARQAPSFKVGTNPAVEGFAYTVASLSEFLGWKEYKVTAALGALALIDDEIATDGTFRDLGPRRPSDRWGMRDSHEAAILTMVETFPKLFPTPRVGKRTDGQNTTI